MSDIKLYVTDATKFHKTANLIMQNILPQILNNSRL